MIDRFKDRAHNLKRHLPYRVIRPGNLLPTTEEDHEDDNEGHQAAFTNLFNNKNRKCPKIKTPLNKKVGKLFPSTTAAPETTKSQNYDYPLPNS